MREVEGTRTFQASAEAYDRFMGRYSRELAGPFRGVLPTRRRRAVPRCRLWSGALTAAAIAHLGWRMSRQSTRRPASLPRAGNGIRHRRAAGPMEQLPFDDGEFDCAAAQLVFHFVSDPERGWPRCGGSSGPAASWSRPSGTSLRRWRCSARSGTRPCASTPTRRTKPESCASGPRFRQSFRGSRAERGRGVDTDGEHGIRQRRGIVGDLPSPGSDLPGRMPWACHPSAAWRCERRWSTASGRPAGPFRLTAVARGPRSRAGLGERVTADRDEGPATDSTPARVPVGFAGACLLPARWHV